MKRRDFLTAVLALAAGPLAAQQANNKPAAAPAEQPEPAPALPVGPEVLHNEAQAVGWLFDAMLKYPESERPYIRSVYLPPYADPEWIGVVDYAMNSALGHGTVLHRGDRHAGGWLLCYNFKRFSPDPVKCKKLLSIWDELALRESQFHVPEINVQTVTDIVEVPQKDQRGQVVLGRDGKPVMIKQNVPRQVRNKVALLAPHLSDALAKHATNPEKSKRIDELLVSMTNSTGAIYPAEFVIEQLLTSARGKYLEFRLVEFVSPVQNVSPLKNHLAKLGFDFDKAQDVKGDKGALILISDVTGKSRMVFTSYGFSSGRPLVGTFDVLDNRIRPDQNFVRNLIEFEPIADGSEWLVPMPNGLIEYLLTDGNRNFVRVAPPNLVSDDEKPKGHTKELEGGMSCILCHRYNDGYRTAKNDMEFILGGDTDYFGHDLIYTNSKGEKVNLTKEEAVDIVSSRFKERIDLPDGPIGRARRDLIKAVDELTDYPITADGPSCVELVADKLREIYINYRYTSVDADRMCMLLGVRVPKGEGRKYLKVLVPPTQAGTEEDIVIGLLRNGASIRRDDVDAIYVECARRALVNRQSLVAAKETK